MRGTYEAVVAVMMASFAEKFGEECREVRSESSGTTQHICWLEESLLLAKVTFSQSE